MVAVAITRTDLTAMELRGAEPGGAGGAADAGVGFGSGRRRPDDGGEDLRDGPADAPRLGPSLQRRRSGRSCEPQSSGPVAQARRGPGCRSCRLGLRPAPIRRRTGSCAGGARTGSCAGGRTFSGASWKGSGWRCTSAQGQFSVGKYLAMLGYRRPSVRPCLCARICAPVSVRPQHPKSDPGAHAVFKTSSARR